MPETADGVGTAGTRREWSGKVDGGETRVGGVGGESEATARREMQGRAAVDWSGGCRVGLELGRVECGRGRDREEGESYGSVEWRGKVSCCGGDGR
jgi:hypothetical protein